MPSGGLLGALALLTVLVYARVGSFGLVYEDAHWLAPATHLPHWAWWQPGQFTHQLELAAGLSLGAQHLVQLGLHLVNGLLIARIAGALGVSAVAAAGVWWLHPLQSEAVVYLAARTDVLACLFLLVALWAVFGVGDAAVPMMAACVALAVLTKPSAIVGMPLLALVLWRYRPWTAVATFGLLMTAGAIGWWPRVLAIVRDPVVWSGGDAWANLTTQSLGLWRLLGLVVWPVGLTIDPDVALVAPWLGILAVSGVIFLTFEAKYSWSVGPLPFVAWVLIAVSPRFVLRLPAVINEHQFGFAMMGVSLAAGWGWTRLRGAYA